MISKYIFISLSFFFILPAKAQIDSSAIIIKTDLVKQKRFGLILIPSRAPNSYGISVGPLGSEAWCGMPYYKKSHGINIQLIGQGAFSIMFAPLNIYQQMADELKNPIPYDSLKSKDLLRAIHNGILYSTLGAIDTKVSGLALSLFCGNGSNLNGIALNLVRNQYTYVNGIEAGLINEAGRVNGLQIGFINKTTELNGLQIGLWNVNEKRKLPIINW